MSSTKAATTTTSLSLIIDSSALVLAVVPKKAEKLYSLLFFILECVLEHSYSFFLMVFFPELYQAISSSFFCYDKTILANFFLVTFSSFFSNIIELTF